MTASEPDTPETTDDLGVTANATLLLGYIAGALLRGDQYAVEAVEAASGNQVIRHRITDNLYRVTVVQIEGTE